MKVQVVEQHDSSDCAAACVASVCAFYKKEISIVKLRELLGTDAAGTTVKSIGDSLSKLGFETRTAAVGEEAFAEGFTLPAIARIVRDDGTAHFVVISKIKRRKIKYMDPAFDRIQKKKPKEFHKDFDGTLVLMVPDNNFVRSKEGAKSVFSGFTSLLKPHMKLFTVAIAASVLLTVFGIVMSVFNKVLIDEIIPYSQDRQLMLYALILAIVTVTQVALSAFRQHTVLYLSQKIDIPLMLGYFRHIFKLPMNFFASRKTGDILTRFQDAGVVQSILTNIALTVIIDVSMVAIVGVILYTMNASLFGIVILLVIVNAVLIFVFKGPYKKLNKRSMEQGARLNSQIIESLNGIETVKTNSAENRVMEKIETEYIKALRIGFGGGVLSNIQGSISGIAGGFGSLWLMVMGGLMVINGGTTLGTLVAFSSLAGFFTDPINRLVSLQLSIQEAGISLNRLAEIYDVKEEEELEAGKDGSALLGGVGTIEIDNVTFRYGSRQPILKGISMTIPKGEKVAIVGRSGCGKTTLSKLLLKFYVPEEGTITFNGSEIRDADAFSLRERIGCVPQNVQLFSGSINDNILIGKPDASPGEIAAACRLSGCDEFLRRLPAGCNTFLDENGGGLSGGEKQRIAMARAIVKRPEFIILDEATSNMDFITEQEIYDTIFDKLDDTTMLIIAHRLSTIRRCDSICVMEGGRIVETGAHDELLEKGGKYAELWNSQVGTPAATPKKRKRAGSERRTEGDEIEYS
ncbi:MAG: peptidase domain-containing ABC transporter [Candidatus Methanoplasma sp.]|jgi:ATP-binding cassette subfamily B protein|nr:peptidase domain-containing ABC transporter [Candidatus Methanoplasma sp.]